MLEKYLLTYLKSATEIIEPYFFETLRRYVIIFIKKKFFLIKIITF